MTRHAASILKYKATTFAGATQHVNVGDVAPLRFERNMTFSLSAWVKFAAGHLGVIVGKTGPSDLVARGYDLHLLSDRRFGANINSDFGGGNFLGFGTAAQFAVDTWHHVVWTYNGNSNVSGCAMYVNGVAQGLITFTNALSATVLTASPFRIGNRDVAVNPLPFAGSVLDVSAYNAVLTPAQVTAIHASHCPPDLTVVGPTANLVGYWLCGEHRGDTTLTSGITAFPTVPGLGSGANNGTMTNMLASAIVTRV